MHPVTSIDVLLIVDTISAISDGSLENNTWFFDSNGYSGTIGHLPGFHTVCWPGDLVTWRVCPLTPGNDIQLAGFTGEMVSRRICMPGQAILNGAAIWEGYVRYRGIPGDAYYTIQLKIDGKEMLLNTLLKCSIL